MERWAELRTAYQVAKLGTVSAAAKMLGYHRATVNRHIDILEAEIGGRIFIRHARGYALTDLGQDLLRVAQKTEELFDGLAGRVQAGKAQIEGEIKLTMLAPVAGLLMPAISDFRSRNPNCLVDIDTSEDLARLEYGEAHIALRTGPKPDHPDYVVSSFGRIGFGLYAHDRYIKTYGLPGDTGDLAGHKFVVPKLRDNRLPFTPWIKDHVQRDMIALSTRDIRLSTEAISAGMGIGFIGELEAKKDGRLQVVFPPDRSWAVPLWIATHVDLHRMDKVQAMLKCIKSMPSDQTGQ